jgi:hypothetical protein
VIVLSDDQRFLPLHSKSLFSCNTLKTLFVNRFDGRSIELFLRLVNLESLAILNARIESLLGLDALVRFRSLRLANLARLKSLNGIAGLRALEELDVHTCRSITSIEAIGS